jgi:hypothetical protein
VSEERCERTDLPVSMCAHCLGHADVIAQAEPRYYPTESVPQTTAQFESRCPYCDGTIFPGDLIYRPQGIWVCEECS